jgi:hypothetical protein
LARLHYVLCVVLSCSGTVTILASVHNDNKIKTHQEFQDTHFTVNLKLYWIFFFSLSNRYSNETDLFNSNLSIFQPLKYETIILLGWSERMERCRFFHRFEERNVFSEYLVISQGRFLFDFKKLIMKQFDNILIRLKAFSLLFNTENYEKLTKTTFLWN